MSGHLSTSKSGNGVFVKLFQRASLYGNYFLLPNGQSPGKEILFLISFSFE